MIQESPIQEPYEIPIRRLHETPIQETHETPIQETPIQDSNDFLKIKNYIENLEKKIDEQSKTIKRLEIGQENLEKKIDERTKIAEISQRDFEVGIYELEAKINSLKDNQELMTNYIGQETLKKNSLIGHKRELSTTLSPRKVIRNETRQLELPIKCKCLYCKWYRNGDYDFCCNACRDGDCTHSKNYRRVVKDRDDCTCPPCLNKKTPGFHTCRYCKRGTCVH